MESTDDDDCHSNKSLDLNFGKKLIDFKLSASSAATQEEQTSSSSSSASSAPQVATESLEEKAATPTSSTAAKQQAEYKHVCRVCKKSFRYATTLARHERAHLSEETQTPAAMEESPAGKEEETESNAIKLDEEEQEMEAEEEEGGVKGVESEAGESESEEEKDKEERSDEEASEPKTSEGGEATGGRVDKRKKICNVCSKRFWSLQDLTRHMRSHTGKKHNPSAVGLLFW